MSRKPYDWDLCDSMKFRLCLLLRHAFLKCVSWDSFDIFLGGGLGFFMGMFLGALDNPLMQEEMTGRQQLIYQAKQMGRRSWSSAKAFAVMGLIFSAAECVVEKV